MLKTFSIIIFITLFWVMPAPGQANEALSELTIFYSNDVRGEIEPCG